MRAARSLEAFVAAPIGSYVRSRTHLWWCHGPTLAGSVHWGRFDEDDLRQLVRAVDFADAPGVTPPLDIITDASRAEIPEASAFRLIHEHVHQHVERFSRVVRRQAIVHAGGLAGAAVAGFMPTIGIHYEWQVFSALDDAFAWLAPGHGATLRSELASMLGEVLDAPPATGGVRDYLDRLRELRGASLRAAGKQLGSSERSLQRRLAAEGTSFRDELAHARVRAATPLLLDGDLKLEVIARTVGCSSLSAFTRLYRRLTGESPSQVRARRTTR